LHGLIKYMNRRNLSTDGLLNYREEKANGKTQEQCQ
jgi:hypothetical protein